MASSVRALLTESTRALQQGDLHAITELYHPNAALHSPGAELIVGRGRIQEHFRKILSQQPADVQHEVTEEHLHEVTPDLAIVDTVGISRWGDHSGTEGFTMIAVRDEEGEWLWAGVRGALVPK